MMHRAATGQAAHTGGARSEDGRAAPGSENGREAPPRAAHEASGTGLAKSAKLAKPARMRAGLLRTSLRFLTWVCVGILGLLSLRIGPRASGSVPRLFPAGCRPRRFLLRSRLYRPELTRTSSTADC
jgi:hypothetical protein